MTPLEKSIIALAKTYLEMAEHHSQHIDYTVNDRRLAEMLDLSNDKFQRREMVDALTRLHAFGDLIISDSGLSAEAAMLLSEIQAKANKLKRIDAFKQYEEGEIERPIIGTVLESAPDD